MAVIRYDGNNEKAWFVYKHPTESFNDGTQLIVHESQEAVFFNNGKDEGHFPAGQYTLNTDSHPFLKGIQKALNGGEYLFHSDVYFVNMTTIMGVKWGTPNKITMFDPATNLPIEIGAFGEFSIRINNPAKVLMKVVGTRPGYDIDDLKGYNGLFMSNIRSILPTVIRDNNINILEVDTQLVKIGELIKIEINKVLNDYGFELDLFNVMNINPEKNDSYNRLIDEYRRLALTKKEREVNVTINDIDRSEALKDAENEAKITAIKNQSIEAGIKGMAYAEAEKIRAEGLAKADVMKAQQYTYNDEIKGQIKNKLAEKIFGPRPMEEESLWECPTCRKRVSGKFCSECGTPRPVVVRFWDCPKCGQKDNDGRFCKMCGANRFDLEWRCENCGAINNGKFCKTCGTERR